MNECIYSKQKVERQIKNLLAAAVMMQEITQDQLVPFLTYWRSDDGNNIYNRKVCSTEDLMNHTCGSAACFGGYVAVCPFFVKQGVRDGYGGAPTMTGLNKAEEVSKHLFGDSHMFDPYFGDGETDGNGRGIEHQAIMCKIQNAMEDRFKELEQLEAEQLARKPTRTKLKGALK